MSTGAVDGVGRSAGAVASRGRNASVVVGAAAVAARSWTVCKIKVAGFVGKRPRVALSCTLHRCTRRIRASSTLIGYYVPPPQLPTTTVPMHDRKPFAASVTPRIDQPSRASTRLSIFPNFACGCPFITHRRFADERLEREVA